MTTRTHLYGAAVNAAYGDGATTATTAVQAAIDALELLGGGTLRFPQGTYIITATLTCSEPIRIEGEAVGATVLQINHTSGPAIQFDKYFSGVSHLTIQGSTTRKNASAGTNYGVYFPTDSAIAQSRFGNWVRDCVISNHSNHGVYHTGQGCVVEDTRILDVGGHGVYFDNFDTDPDYQAGYAEVKNAQIVRCTGHGVAAGINRATFRITLDNVDIFHCALSGSVRQGAYSAWMGTEDLIARNCGFAGWSGDSPSRVATVAGLYVNGRSPRIESNRFIDVATNAIELGADADGATIEDNHIVGEVQADLDPAVKVHASCTGVYVRWGFPTYITHVMTEAPANSGNRAEIYDVSPQGVRSTLNAYTIADDAVAEIDFTAAGTWGVMLLAANASGAEGAMVAFRVGDGSAYCTLLTTATNVNVTTGALTGTTGTDGKFTISAGSAANKLYLENRRGAQYVWRPTFLSLYGGELEVI